MQQNPALFVGDAKALDFLNSVATPIDAAVEWLEDGDGLVSWLRQAELVAEPLLETLRAQALPGELDQVALQARDLREWFRSFVKRHQGRPLKADALEELNPLNRLLERDESFAQIEPARRDADRPLDLITARRWRSTEALLFPIAEILAQFVCTEDFTYVKACEGAACTLLFADHTRGRGRRWCSMAVCGNRAKQAAHRNRASRSRKSRR